MSIISFSELNGILQSTGFPVAYSHFVESENNPLPQPPFITYIVAYSSNFAADDRVYQQIRNVQIELYTDTKDFEAERKIEAALDSGGIVYQSTEAFIESEQLFQKIYEVSVI